MKTYFKRGVLLLAIGFVIFFGLRLGYGYLFADEDSASGFNAGAGSYSGFNDLKKNYASEKLKFDRADNQPISVDQKYEKVADLQSRTRAFEDDERKIRDSIKSYNAQIQFEQNSGLQGGRRLNLAIGVQPAKFDSMVAAVKGIGSLSSIQINKTDKTNEYKDLNAKRVSIEKARDALVSLQTKGGKIDELINLESKILELETDLQEAGVKLGEYDAENEFCTIKFSLTEEMGGKAKISFLYRVGVALRWTIKYYAVTVLILLAGSLATFLTILVLEKLKVLPARS